MICARDVLIYLAVKYEGDWNKIYYLIHHKEDINFDEIEAFDVVKNLQSNVVTMVDKEYPSCFKYVHHPPFVIFYHGDISLLNVPQKTLSVIGSRKCSEYSIESTKKIIKELSNEYVIVSGLARGIDTVAHMSAIESGKRTIAVLGSGINNCYPSENIDLYKEIGKNHLVISEYPNLSTPDGYRFPQRNRLVAAIGQGVFVAEAHKTSGTYFTIEFALGMGKTVMCLPTRINEESICNRIIKEGAFLVENSEDIELCLSKSFF